MDTTWETILVVDDEQGMCDVICSILEEEGYRVLQADDGETALAILEKERPSLILSDVTMPGMDGFALYAWVHATSQWFQIPFIFITARDQMIDVRHGMELGADDYLIKPFEPEALVAAVKVRLARAAATEAAIYRGTQNLRDTILRTLSHELRTPLTLLMGYGELLETSAQRLNDGGFFGLLQGLRTGSERLLHLVESFLLLSKLESGALQGPGEALQKQTFQPDTLVANVVQDFQSRAAARQVFLTLHRGAAGACITADPQCFMEIVRHLVDNAIKFSKTKGGDIVLSTRTDHAHWVLDVADQGVGIRPDALGYTFQAFRQVDREKMEQQGAGLGLAIVRGLVQLHGGQVDVESELGRGSTFTVWLPLVTG